MFVNNIEVTNVFSNRTNITDSGLEALASGPVHWSLRELRVDRCHKITDDGIEAVLVTLHPFSNILQWCHVFSFVVQCY